VLATLCRRLVRRQCDGCAGPRRIGPLPPTPAPSSATVQLNGRHDDRDHRSDPDQAEVVRWAQRAEKLDPQNYITLGLALRSSKDDSADVATEPGLGKPYGITFATLVAVYGVLPPDPTATLPKVLADKIKW
jgi:hypothetical protein